MDTLLHILPIFAPWIAALMGIGTAVFAEQAFAAASQAEPPEQWPGAESSIPDFDLTEVAQERAGRDSLRARAAALQSVATFLAAGAAVEAAAASQTGLIVAILTTVGIIVAVVPSVVRWKRASDEVAYTKALYANMEWSVKRKFVRSQDSAEEEAAFAKDRPREAAILRRRPKD